MSAVSAHRALRCCEQMGYLRRQLVNVGPGDSGVDEREISVSFGRRAAEPVGDDHTPGGTEQRAHGDVGEPVDAQHEP